MSARKPDLPLRPGDRFFFLQCHANNAFRAADSGVLSFLLPGRPTDAQVAGAATVPHPSPAQLRPASEGRVERLGPRGANTPTVEAAAWNITGAAARQGSLLPSP
ncbi:hypothetical protein MPTK1_Vg00268 [Marchantia polymorpha subsp. ruderalis]|nr:hypothetical protein Mp_Vg00268 [Marchantia polymorpha subsp. ruderalis]